jgi:hypothetical protein
MGDLLCFNCAQFPLPFEDSRSAFQVIQFCVGGIHPGAAASSHCDFICHVGVAQHVEVKAHLLKISDHAKFVGCLCCLPFMCRTK